MGHVAGFGHYEGEADYTPTSHCDRASEGWRRFADRPLLFEPETRYRYSTDGWILVSAAVEAAAGESFFTFMRRQVFEPAGMSATVVDSATGEIPDRVTFYYPRFSGDPSTGPDLARTVDYSCFAGAGAFLSTPSDLVRFGLALQTGKLLKRHTVSTLQSPQLLASGEETEYGLGWMLDTVTLGGEPTREAGHASLTLLGSSTSFLTFPERGLVVAVMANISRANTRSIALRIAESFAR
jgi:CubicO group peptidase (beta-lactamase class C family)